MFYSELIFTPQKITNTTVITSEKSFPINMEVDMSIKLNKRNLKDLSSTPMSTNKSKQYKLLPQLNKRATTPMDRGNDYSSKKVRTNSANKA